MEVVSIGKTRQAALEAEERVIITETCLPVKTHLACRDTSTLFMN